MNALFRLRGVETRRGTHRVLAIPALEVPPGGVSAIVGPNGAGKTTLLRLLASLEEPTTGEVVRDPVAAAVIYVEQSPFLFRGTVESNVAFGLRAQGGPRAGRALRIAEVLERVGLRGLGRRRAAVLSGGERRRVALARALALQPAALLFDEPFAEVDPGEVARLERVLRAEGERATVIFTTHDLAQAHRVANRVLSLVAGAVCPVSTRNAFHGSVALRDGRAVFRSGAFEFEVPDGHPDAVLAVIDPEAVLVSVEPLSSSARNGFPGTVTRAEAADGLVQLAVDCGAALFATVTRASYEELRLNVGRTVWVTFKSSTVHLYGARED